jgi:hypothetical protein
MKIRMKDFQPNFALFKYQIGTKTDKMYYVSLFAAVTGVHLAVLYTWLGQLHGFTDEINRRILVQLDGDTLE